MTSVVGHLTGLDFDRQYKGWMSCPPGSLFEAPVQETVDKVGKITSSCLDRMLMSSLGQATNCGEHPEPSQVL